MTCDARPQRVSWETEWGKEKMSARAFTGVPWERMGKAGEVGLGLTSLNHYSGLWGVGSVPSCLVPVPGVIRTEEQWPRVE